MQTLILLICAAVTLAVFVVMIYSVATFRIGREVRTLSFRPKALIEVVWTLIPIVILVSAALPAMRMLAGG
jgi:cytochrome c oxidase subunit 2